jgi:hypothetical protein
MNTKLVVMSVAVFVGLITGCDKAKDPADKPAAQIPPTMNQPPQPSSKAAAGKDGVAPIQGQVDTKQPAQRRDFETKKP